MKVSEKVMSRSGGKCELCQKKVDLAILQVSPERPDNEILICSSLIPQIDGSEELIASDWTFLPDAMWSEVPAVQVLAWRMLNRLKSETWAAEALEILYLDDETREWAEDWTAPEEPSSNIEVHKDAYGNILQDGDSVVLTKTLDVKGSSISAKLGTVVRNIRLVPDHSDQIEGRVEGQQIVILTKYLRKQS
ncbi:MAG TPA: PhnA domain-containing protein [Sphingobacteriaceae bacterium]|nr:PhnA domain-containing protein [Sphingobacteriaceae bacterium]